MTKWLIASNNSFKTADLQACLALAGIEAVGYTTQYPAVTFPAEGTASYAVNAQVKAEFLANLLHQPVIADDSGLELAALQNELGVTTQRDLAGSSLSTNAAVLARLDDLPADQRGAQMVTLLAAARPNHATIISSGTVTGQIVMTPRGQQSGGFDKIFQPTGQAVTLAEMPASKRLPLTHRGQAALALRQKLLMENDR
ncbi:non-canonical purine NTP pyrophosphatase [Periweissella fabalis]|uniref:Non-canonical purine NTP pyrophosphatase n=1 Tax=Periweissella fabalis TaxID=1070421 RepID=A0A7X6N4K9_9LACO|nr:non-canonical purine NTP pyrophosphatase [Periweissella fabalis]MCM0599540.1 non-canonical purine NTP pyrophosphatase [Periweissella fabalis]NKZ23845.1 non-canonical purine NTP pyrophosphatase [Periweissella fabalis]